MKRAIFGFVVLAVVCGAVLADERTDAEVKELEGVWNLEAVEIKGKKLDAPKGKGGSIVFAKDMKVIMKEPNKPDKQGRYKIEVGTNPKQLDLIELKDGKDEEVIQVIYEIEDDTLRMGFSADGLKGKRPTEFKGERVGIMHFKRQKP
jgi:uncharacterized protein (TIGR03067 family)